MRDPPAGRGRRGMKSTGPTEKQYDHLAAPFTEAAGAVAVMLNPGGRQRQWVAAAERIVERMDAACRPIQGNRPDGTSVTWDDVRLVTAAKLRILLEELEPPSV